MGGTRLSSRKGKYSEIVPKQFQNFTAPLLVTVAKLSLNEEIEIVAGECLNRLILNLPPITLVEPIAVLCSNKHDNDELRNIGLTQALKLPKRFKDELKMVSRRFQGVQKILDRRRSPRKRKVFMVHFRNQMKVEIMKFLISVIFHFGRNCRYVESNQLNRNFQQFENSDAL